MSRNEFVSLESLCKICFVLACDIGDVMEFIENEPTWFYHLNYEAIYWINAKVSVKKVRIAFYEQKTAVFMADLFEVPENKVQFQILDAGAALAYCLLRYIERLQALQYIRWYVMKTVLKSLTCCEKILNITAIIKY